MPVSRADLEATLARLSAEVRDPRAGLFGPSSKLWQVNREAAVFLGAGRAALLQTAHPFVASGVEQHSKTRTEPLGRFARTFEAVFAMVYGDLDHALQAARRVHTIHERITGAIAERTGSFAAGARYAANTEDALLWVHATLWDTSVQCFELLVRPLSRAEKNAYHEETKRFARLFGISDQTLPETWEDFVAYNERAWDSSWLEVGPPAAETARFLLRAPSPALAPVWKVYTTLTAGLMPPRLRERFELPFGRAEQRLFDVTVAALRRAYPRLPPALRHLPAYRAAMDRLGEEPAGPVARLLVRAVTEASRRFARGSKARAARAGFTRPGGSTTSLAWLR